MKTFAMFAVSFALLFPHIAIAQDKTSGGRFQLVQLSTMRRDQYLLDTQTGKVWSKVCLVDGESTGDCAKIAWLLETVEGLGKSKEQIFKDAAVFEKFLKEEASNRKPSGSD